MSISLFDAVITSDSKLVGDIHFVKQDCVKEIANGMRDMSKTSLTEKEIDFVRSEIRRIKADESTFVFNDERYIALETCYNFDDDKVYVTRNVFPNNSKYGPTHPRDWLSVGAILAYEFYGHRYYRDEYLKRIGFYTTPIWQNECRAGITAAKLAPNLTDKERSNLVLDAVYRAKEYGKLIEMDDFMKEVLYGYPSRERNIAWDITPIHYVSETGEAGSN